MKAKHHTTKRHLLLSLYAAMTILASTSTALADNHIRLVMTAEKEIIVIGEDGKQQLKRVKTETMIPGDVVVYTIIYSNNGDQPADNIVVTDPLPVNTGYIGDSALGTGTLITFSIDQGESFDSADRLRVSTEDGKDRPAKADDYTHIRWQLQSSVAPGKQGSMSFKARIQ